LFLPSGPDAGFVDILGAAGVAGESRVPDYGPDCVVIYSTYAEMLFIRHRGPVGSAQKLKTRKIDLGNFSHFQADPFSLRKSLQQDISDLPGILDRHLSVYDYDFGSERVRLIHLLYGKVRHIHSSPDQNNSTFSPNSPAASTGGGGDAVTRS